MWVNTGVRRANAAAFYISCTDTGNRQKAEIIRMREVLISILQIKT